jgi:hypothetical protein
VGREDVQPAHQHVKQPLARRFIRHVGVLAGQHLAVDLLDVCGEDCQRRGELGAQLGERQPGVGGNLRHADLLERLLGQQREERLDRLVAV